MAVPMCRVEQDKLGLGNVRKHVYVKLVTECSDAPVGFVPPYMLTLNS